MRHAPSCDPARAEYSGAPLCISIGRDSPGRRLFLARTLSRRLSAAFERPSNLHGRRAGHACAAASAFFRERRANSRRCIFQRALSRGISAAVRSDSSRGIKSAERGEGSWEREEGRGGDSIWELSDVASFRRYGLQKIENYAGD